MRNARDPFTGCWDDSIRPSFVDAGMSPACLDSGMFCHFKDPQASVQFSFCPMTDFEDMKVALRHIFLTYEVMK